MCVRPVGSISILRSYAFNQTTVKNAKSMPSSRWTQQDVQKVLSQQAKASAKPSKYRNVKTVVDGRTFDSKREAQFYHDLKLREKAGEIRELACQVPFQLYAPTVGPRCAPVCVYVSDFVFVTCADNQRHVVDVKGARTAMYKLKARWLNIQSGIVIEEVR